MATRRTYWFGRKQIGWGVSPSSWQGWATITIYCVLMITLARLIDPAFHQVLAVSTKVVLTLALLLVIFLKFDRSKQE